MPRSTALSSVCLKAEGEQKILEWQDVFTAFRPAAIWSRKSTQTAANHSNSKEWIKSKIAYFYNERVIDCITLLCNNQWRLNEINIAGARRGPNSKPKGLSRGWGSLGPAVSPLPTSYGVRGSAVSSPKRVQGEAPAVKSFGTFWVLQVSSPAVLLLSTSR